MGGVVRSSFGKPLAIVRYTTIIAANTTVNILPIWPLLGWGTIRLFIESDVAGTFNFLQKARNGTFRQSDSQAVAAATGTPIEVSCAADYGRLQYANGGTIQTRFTFNATLHP